MTLPVDLRFTQQIQMYLKHLERGDVDAICALLTPDAQICSPFLGWMDVRDFFEKVVGASSQSTITPIDICISAMVAPRATAYFIYDWVLKDGTAVRFHCVDIFEFNAGHLIERMNIVYDTHPVRSVVGDKYSSAALPVREPQNVSQSSAP